jgi:hypothetical protein
MKKPVHNLMGFTMDKNHEFIVVGQFCFGVAETIEDAMKKARSVGGDVSRCYCKIIPKKKFGGEWEICQMTGGISIRNSDKWDYKKDEVFLQTWNKNFHVGGNKSGKVIKYGFDLFN